MKKLFFLPFLAGILCLAACPQADAGTVKINEWLIAGPFTSDKPGELIQTPFINEPDAAPAEGDTAGINRWKKFNGPFVNFLKAGYAITENCAAYAFTYVYSLSDQLAVMYFGSDDGAAIWLNGSKVWDKPVRRSMVENQDTVRVFLGKGWNRLLFKIDQGGGDWSMVCGVNAEEVKFSTDRPAPEAMVAVKDLAVTGIDVSAIGAKIVTMKIDAGNYGKSDVSGIQFFLVDASGITTAKTRILKIQAGKKAHAEITVGTPAVCRLLSRDGAAIRMVRGGNTSQVDIPLETALKLFLELISNKDLAGADISARAGQLGNTIGIYGMGGDLAQSAKKGLALIADGKMTETKPLLEEMEQSILGNVPDLRGDSIFVTGHAHMDMNWLWPYNESVKMFHDNFRQIIAFMEKFPDYRFIQSQATIYRHIELMDPPLFEKVKKYVGEGRLELAGGMWTEGDVNLTGGEALCRSFLLGQLYFLDKFDKTARVGWLPDNFGHISQLPQLLKLSGLDFYYFHRCVPHIGPFWWMGPDSSKVLCFTNYGYNGDITVGLKDDINRIAPVTRKILAPTGVGDHGGGPTLKNIRLVHKLDSIPRYPSVKFATAESFFISNEKLDIKLPVHRSEMQFIFEGCYTSVAEIKENTRLSEQMMYQAEYLSALRWIDGEPYPAAELKDLWETVAFNQFHDILPGSAIYETYQDAAADHKMVQKKAGEIIDAGFRKLADEIKFREGLGQPLVVLNMHPISGRMLVEGEVYTHEQPLTARLSTWGDYYEYGHVRLAEGYNAATVRIMDGQGHTYPAQITGGKAFPPGFRSRIQFVADRLPAGGYNTYYVDASDPGPDVKPVSRTEGDFETEYFLVRMDMKTGDITRLLDKRTGKEYVPQNGRLNRLQVWLEVPNGMNAWTIGKITDIQDVTDVVSVAVIENGPVRATVEVVKKWGKSKFIQRTHIYRDYPRIDFYLEAHWFETGDGVNPAPFLKAAFDLAIDNPEFDNQVPFDVVKRPVNGQEVPAQQWVDVTDGKNGIALLNRTKFGHSFDKGQLRLSLLRATYSPNLYPNIGINHIQYSLFPHPGDWKNRVWHEAAIFNIPALAGEPPSLALVKTHATRPEKDSLLMVDPPGVVLSGIKQAENGTDLVIRLAETEGKEQEATISLPAAAKSAVRVNIIEQPLETYVNPVVSGRRIQVLLKPHEIVTLDIKLN
jgi:alpha-mannosidase